MKKNKPYQVYNVVTGIRTNEIFLNTKMVGAFEVRDGSYFTSTAES